MHVSALWRHPIKSHGRESIESVELVAGQTMPWDRAWAVTHEATQPSAKDGDWAPCHNFVIGTRTPGLAGLWARLDEGARRVTLRHEALGELTFCPDDAQDQARFLDWIAPLCPANRSRPTGIVSAGARGMTDSAFPSISIMTTASHQAVAAPLGGVLEPERWRGNIWLDGAAPREENDWIGHEVRIGGAVLRVEEPIERCAHTTANPFTGQRDADTLGTLERSFGHQNFGVYARVIEGGTVRVGDKAGRA
ncbi:MOSC domain-containing protein [Marimonas sp. MJW-29]|uniref:MOSC domain-containing protein n=1 Tax=Sulfitobacter sediminis TaxID=3234186 RepID=A0ABV3RLM7_9RHOB